MTKFNVIVADPPWKFSDKLRQSKTKRGAQDIYSVMSIKDIKAIDVPSISDKDCLLALWCPSSLLKEGIEVMEAWGFTLKQTHVWVKTKKNPFRKYINKITRLIKNKLKIEDEYNINDCLAFGMGHLFRQTHELVLIGTKGKITSKIQNKSQRSVHFFEATKHSKKPEALQDMLEIMFPDSNLLKLELFARRDRDGWICAGNECLSSFGEDINDSIERLKNVVL